MAISQTVNFSVFCDAFIHAGRDHGFSYDAKKIIFDYLDEMSDDCGDDIELDVIAICCGYTEMHYTDVIAQYSHMLDVSGLDEDDEEALIEAVEKFLQENTIILGRMNDNCFVYAQF